MQQVCLYNFRTANSTRDDDRDEVSSTVSYLSDISGLSELSGQEWKPMAGRQSLLVLCSRVTSCWSMFHLCIV
jgi:hypothetical protein